MYHVHIGWQTVLKIKQPHTRLNIEKQMVASVFSPIKRMITDTVRARKTSYSNLVFVNEIIKIKGRKI